MEYTFSKTSRLNENVFHMKPKWDEKKSSDSQMVMTWSNDQDGRHAIKCSKPWKNILLQNHLTNCLETWYGKWPISWDILIVQTLEIM